MPLTKSDIARIEALGYKKSDFVVKDGTVFRLRNVEGKCFFLDSKNRCIIYEYRPEGCRLYPAVFDGKDVVADSLCPKWTEVKITVHSKQKLLTLIKSIYGEKVFNE
jgi:Fe-S-cluster containining protein